MILIHVQQTIIEITGVIEALGFGNIQGHD